MRLPGIWLVGLAASTPREVQCLVSKQEHLSDVELSDANARGYQPTMFRPEVMGYMENCTHWQDNPMFAGRWKSKKEIRDQYRTLYILYDFTCRRKPPAGGMIDLGMVDTGPILEKLKQTGEDVWLEDHFRQQKFKVHSQTNSILFVWRKNLMTDTEEKPHWAEWKSLLEPAIRQAAKYYGYDPDAVDVWKAMLARLPPGASIAPHPDAAPALNFPHRIHWAISGEDGVRTMIGRDELPIRDGQLFEFNNIPKHSVSNEGQNHRIHAIFDLVPKKLPKGIELQSFPEPRGYYYGGDYDEEEEAATADPGMRGEQSPDTGEETTKEL
eukprot:TRINITY_DN101276_c0_g1_i1.p1 TRINITY_DN101276_c0_g1~~TRINITY_DN101276_c0_g1_i1.p1  ORF type:complete len:326 (+),score=65.55 TRINITY_DN101276_c0_g1_i1:148-1125(+)